MKIWTLPGATQQGRQCWWGERAGGRALGGGPRPPAGWVKGLPWGSGDALWGLLAGGGLGTHVPSTWLGTISMATCCCCCIVGRLCLTLCDHGLQHIRLPCPSLSPRVCSNSCPLSRWCHRITSSSVATFSSRPQSFPVSGSFPMSWLFASGGHSIGASASVLPINIQGWFPLRLTGLIALLSKGLPSSTVRKHQFIFQLSLWSNSDRWQLATCYSPPTVHQVSDTEDEILSQLCSWEDGSERLSHESKVTQQENRFSFLLLQILSSVLRLTLTHLATPSLSGSQWVEQGFPGSQPWPAIHPH